jgi:nuclear pore complex protein Nup205
MVIFVGENQQSQFPGLSRGLVAVLLYYDGRVALVSALKALLQSRPGLTWAPCADVDLQKMITKYTDELISSGLISKILSKWIHQ